MAHVVTQIDRLVGQGWKHMQCSRCHEPLLVFSIFNADVASRLLQTSTKPSLMLVNGEAVPDPSIIEEATRVATYTEYRSAKGGPDSPILSNCPKCSVLLDVNTVCDIED